MAGGAETRALWSITLPIIFAEISETIAHLTDTIMLARVGVIEVGAIALADAILEIVVVLTAGVIDGIQILVARRIGEGKDRAVGRTFSHGLAILTAVSLVLTVLLVLLAGPLTRLLIGTPEVATPVEAFLRIASIGIVFNAVNFAYSALFVGFGTTRVLIWATLVLGGTNLAFDWVLIFGNLGFPALGIRGAALGTVGAEIATCAFLTWYLLKRFDVRRYGLFDLGRWDRGLARALVRISSPIAFQALVESVRWFAFFLIVERMGVRALAQSNIVYTCYTVFLIPTEGFSETACSKVSSLIGAGRSDRIRLLLREVIAATYLVTLPLAAFTFLFPEAVLAVFGSGDPAFVGAAASLRVLAVAMLVIIPAEMWFTAVSGTGDTKAAFGIEVVLSLVTLVLAGAAGIGLGLGVEYVWVSLPIACCACLVLSYAWMRSGRWERLRI
jgi:putative MATE family efflux protein